MKKNLLCLFMLLTLGIIGFAQELTTITIGTGIDENYNLPLNTYYKNSWSEMIYPDSLISEHGTISSIGFDVSAVPNGDFMCSTLTIYMGVTPNKTHSTTSDWVPMDALTEVYSATDWPLPTATGWLTFDLDDPFPYDGGNLVIVVSKTMPNYTNGLKFRYTAANNSCLSRRNDNNLDYASHPGSNTGTRNNQLPNLQLTFFNTVDFCHAVSNFTITAFSAYDAVFSWTAPEDTSNYILQCKTADADWEGDNVVTAYPTEIPYTLTNLEPNTRYVVRVANACSNNEYSSWRTTAFKTECAAISVAESPYIESFEGYATYAFPDCWTKIAGYVSGSYNYPDIRNSSSTAHSGTGYLFLSNTADNPIITALPQFVEDLSTLRLSFWMKPGNTSSFVGRLELGIMADLADTSTFTLLQSWSTEGIGSTDWAYYGVNLDTLIASNTGYLVFRRYAENGTQLWYFDDVQVMPIPACEIPTGLTVAYTESFSVNLTWDELPGTYNIYYKADTDTGYSSVNNVVITDADSVCVLGNLSPTTQYQVYVAAVCEDGSEVASSSTVSFSTLCAPEATPYSENFNAGNNIPNCWERFTGLVSDAFAGTNPTPSTTGWQFNNTHAFGKYHPKVNIYSTNCKYWLVSPAIDLDGLETPALTFDLAMTGYNSDNPGTAGDDDRFLVLISTDDGSSWSADNVTEWNNSSVGDYVLNQIPALGEVITVPLTQYAGQSIRVAFYGESTASSGDIDLHIDNVMVGEMPACTKPLHLHASNITTHSAEIAWAGFEDANSWTVEYGPVGFTTGSGNTVTVSDTPSSVLYELNPGTDYEFRVAAVCGETASLQNFANFRTADCGTISLPYSEDFESYTESTVSKTGIVPTCWELVQEDAAMTDGKQPQLCYKSDYAHSGNYSLMMYNRGIFAMPPLSNDIAIEHLLLEMYLRQAKSYYKLEVGVWEDDSTFTVVKTINNSTTNVEFVEVDFSGYTGSGHRIAFRNINTNNPTAAYSYNYIDDIVLTEVGGCDLVFEMHDSYGDGWNGNKILIHNGGTTKEVTLVSGHEGTETVTVHDGALELEWVNGQYTTECSFSVKGQSCLNYSGASMSAGVFLNTEMNCDNNNMTATPNFTWWTEKTCNSVIVHFENNSNEAENAIWNFGDSTSTEEFSPTHEYTANGSYPVTLSVNNSGCESWITVTNNVVVTIPEPIIHYLDTTVCESAFPILWHGMEISEEGIYEDVLVTAAGCDSTVTLILYTHLDTIPYFENFESYTESTVTTTGVEPTCWELVQEDVTIPEGKQPQLCYKSEYAHSGDYSLMLNYRGIYAMPKLSENIALNALKLEMYLRQPKSYYKLEVGVWEDDGTFTLVQTVNNSTTEVEPVAVDFSNYTGSGHRIAFHNINTSSSPAAYSYNYLDDITITESEDCAFLTFAMHDNHGDGWNGNKIIIHTAGFAKEVTLASGSEGTDTVTIHNGPLSLEWVNGNYSHECSFFVTGPCLSFSSVSSGTPTAGMFLNTEIDCNRNGTPAIPAFSWWVEDSCNSVIVHFENSSTNAENIIWDFGDGTTSNEFSPTHEYTETGTYEVTLSTNNSECTLFNSITNNVTVTMPEHFLTMPYFEDFENHTASTGPATGVEPCSWELVQADAEMPDGKRPQLYYKSAYAHSGNYSLMMYNRGIYAMPALSENILALKYVRMEMYLRQPYSYYQLQVGVWEDSTFVPVTTLNNSSNGVEHVTVDFSNYTGTGRRIAFRNINTKDATTAYSYNYIDDILLDAPIANPDFTWWTETTCNSVIAHFENNSTNAETAVWNFGDGTTSEDYSPTHEYTADGSYHVTLVVGNGAYATRSGLSFDVEVTMPSYIITPPYNEDFESHTTSTGPATGVEPCGWELVQADAEMPDGKQPQLYYKSTFAHSGNYSLMMYNRGIYAMPPLLEGLSLNNVHIEMYLRQPYSYYQLIVGVWEDDSTFTPVDTLNNSTNGMELVGVDFSSYTGTGKRIAFRNINTKSASAAYSYNYIDDIVLTGTECLLTIENYSGSMDWGGGAKIRIHNNGSVEEVSFSDYEYWGTKTVIVHNGPIELEWVDGDYPGACAFIITGPSCIHYEGAPDPGVFLSTTIDCNQNGTPAFPNYFSWWTETTCNSTIVHFKNNSINAENAVWDFGDGTNSNEFSPIHEYTNSGNYSVTLSVNNSKCENWNTETYSLWVEIPDPVIITLPYSENFESYTQSTTTLTGFEPTCWELVQADAEMPDGKQPQLCYKSDYAHSGNYSLMMNNCGIYAMPPLSENIAMKHVHLTMYLRQPKSYYQLEVGVWEDDNTFTLVATLNNSTSDVEYVEVDFSDYTGTGKRIAFRNLNTSSATAAYSYNYIDDIVLTEEEGCATITVENYSTEPSAWAGSKIRIHTDESVKEVTFSGEGGTETVSVYEGPIELEFTNEHHHFVVYNPDGSVSSGPACSDYCFFTITGPSCLYYSGNAPEDGVFLTKEIDCNGGTIALPFIYFDTVAYTSDFPLIWHGRQFDEAGSFTTVMQNASGCDSTVIITVNAIHACPGLPSVTDIDGNVYSTVKIGDQCWMRENLRSTHFADGSDIPAGGSFTSSSEPYYYNYSNANAPFVERGYLYNWPAAMQVCPTGWHLPSDEEWNELERSCGMGAYDDAQTEWRGEHARLMAVSNYWNSYSATLSPGNMGCTDHNVSGFSAVPTGVINNWGTFYTYGNEASYFWSSTEESSNNVWFRGLSYRQAGLRRGFYNGFTDDNNGRHYDNNKGYGYSVRCLHDEIVCTAITLPYTENFESYTQSTTTVTGFEPPCWELVQADAEMPEGKQPQLYYKSAYAHSGNYSLIMYNRGIYAMPRISENIAIKHVHLEMYLRQPYPYYKLVVGVWEDDSTFTPVDTLDNTTNGVEFVTVDFSNYVGDGKRIAFRNLNTKNATAAYSYNYIDDIVLTETEGCTLTIENHSPSWALDFAKILIHNDGSVKEVTFKDYDSNGEEIVYDVVTVKVHNGPLELEWVDEGYFHNSYSSFTITDSSCLYYNGYPQQGIFLNPDQHGMFLITEIDCDRSSSPAIPDFTWWTENTCDGVMVHFENNSMNAENVTWLFSDGTSSEEYSPVHEYTWDASFEVTLSVNNSMCEDWWNSLTKNVDVLVPKLITTTFDTVVHADALPLSWHGFDATESFSHTTVYEAANGCDSTVTISVRVIPDGDALPCPGYETVSDYDGNVYNTVQIGNQCWMRENMRVTHYADGTDISSDEYVTYEWDYPYAPSDVNLEPYGHRYSWYAMMHDSYSSNTNPSGVQGLCPTGWHVPSDAEWTQLTEYVSSVPAYWCGGDNNNIAKALSSTTGWSNNSNNYTCAVGFDMSTNNATGFSAQPAHRGDVFGEFCEFWSASEFDNQTDIAIERHLFNDGASVIGAGFSKSVSLPVRCLLNTSMVTTAPVNDITPTSATCGGTVTYNGNDSITARGVCWSTEPYPTIDGNHTSDGSGAGAFTSSITNLLSNTTYYVRAYATNSKGTVYGEEVSFTSPDFSEGDGLPCPGNETMTDYDGNVYNTVKIGLQCWMKENLRTTHFADGVEIPEYASYSFDVAYRYAPNNDQNNIPEYGYLYNWTAAMHGALSSSENPSNVQGICPPGWHLPSNAEWTQFTDYVGSIPAYCCNNSWNNINKALAATTGWNNYYPYNDVCYPGNDMSTNNATGFSALPAGFNGNEFGKSAYFWSSSEVRDYWAAFRELQYHNASIFGMGYGYPKTSLYSVRCLLGDGAVFPTVITVLANNPSDSTIVFGGEVTNDGGTSVTARGVCWGTHPNPTLVDSYTSDGSGTGAFSSDVSPLHANTTYYVRAYATNSIGTGYGAVDSFTTQNFLDVTTAVVDNLTSNSAMGGGRIYGDGISPVTTRGVCWSTDHNPTVSDAHTSDGTGTGPFTSTITGLTPESIYYVRAYATNSDGTVYGNEVQFKATCPTYFLSDDFNDGEINPNKWIFSENNAYVEDGVLRIPHGAYFKTANLSVPTNGKVTMDRHFAAETSGDLPVYCGYNIILNGDEASFIRIEQYASFGDYGIILSYRLNGEETQIYLGEFLADTWLNEHVELNFSSGMLSFNMDAINDTVTIPELLSQTVGYYNVEFFIKDGGRLTTQHAMDYVSIYGDIASVTTNAVTNISDISADCGGSVSSDDCNIFSEFGVCWSTSHNPTVGNAYSVGSGSTDSFTSTLTELMPGTTYYVRAYASNDMGATYGNEVSFTTSFPAGDAQPCPGNETLTDYDGNVYNTVKIGEQCWMRENLRTTHYADGAEIPSGTSHSNEVAYRYYPDNDSNNVSVYGYLYNRTAIMHGGSWSWDNPIDLQGICPEGWHLPSSEEWNQLRYYINSVPGYLCEGENDYIAKALASSVGWNSDNGDCTVGSNQNTNNITGFSALPAGYFQRNGNYANFGNTAAFWSSSGNGYSLEIQNANMPTNNLQRAAFSVRCVLGDGVNIASVVTDTVSDITAYSAACGGEVISDGESEITEIGLCWSTDPNPNFNNWPVYGVTDSSGMTTFSLSMSNLSPNTTYYVRAYAYNSAGISYGNVVSFTTPSLEPIAGDALPCPDAPTVTDYDGNIYNTVKIGEQCWMKENLRATHYADGLEIANRNYPDNNANNVTDFGCLYNWAAVMHGSYESWENPSGIQGICPDGWHLPSDAEWSQLTTYLGDVSTYNCGGDRANISKTLADTLGWNNSDGNCSVGNDVSGNNMSGFGARPAGYYNNGFSEFGESAYFWTTTPYYPTVAGRMLQHFSSEVSSPELDMEGGYSVRCVRGEGLNAPSVVTYPVTMITETSAFGSATVPFDGGSEVIERGFCWSLSQNPTIIYDNHTSDVSETGSSLFGGHLTDLLPNRTYFVRAYAINNVGISYGNEVSFTTVSLAPADGDNEPCTGIPIVTDIDGNVYNTVKIGNQCWMKENLRTTRFADGVEIPFGGGSWPYDVAYLNIPAGDSANIPTYGYLYNWAAVMHDAAPSNEIPSGVQGICPSGWHVPSSAEWDQLTDYVLSVGEYTYADSNIISANFGETFPGFYSEGQYFNFGQFAYFWSSTETDQIIGAEYHYLNRDNNNSMGHTGHNKWVNCSVRCLRDEAPVADNLTGNAATDEQPSNIAPESLITEVADITTPLGVDGFTEALANFTVYPNPTNGVVNVQFSMENGEWIMDNGLLGSVEIHVLDAYGKLVNVVKVQPYETVQIDLSRYARGVYFVKAVADGNVVGVKKVVRN